MRSKFQFHSVPFPHTPTTTVSTSVVRETARVLRTAYFDAGDAGDDGNDDAAGGRRESIIGDAPSAIITRMRAK